MKNLNYKQICSITLSLIFLVEQVYAYESNESVVSKSIYQTNQRFHPQIGTKGAVATQESNASTVGIDILQQGGNAVDAAVAIGYALAVTLPRAGNIGGGGFMTIWLNKEQKAYIINYRETTPAKVNIKEITELYNTDKDKFIYSYKSSGIPGTVAGLNLAAREFGKLGKTDFKTLVSPSIALAENGFNLTYSYLDSLKLSENYFKLDPEAKRTYLDDSNIFPSATKKNTSIFLNSLNYKFRQPDLAKTLKLIAENNDDGFYRGETADSIVSAMKQMGGYITKEDLENYKAKIANPIIINYKDYKIIAPPPPSAGGVVLAEQLNMLNALKKEFSKLENNTAKYYHYLTEIMNISYKDRNYKLGDPNFTTVNIDQLTSQAYADSLAQKVDKNSHISSQEILKWPEGNNTTHYVVIDKDLNVVSNTYTLNREFGNNKIIPGAGFFMNNELDDFAVDITKPNTYGLIQGENNLIKPLKQPLSSMAPVIVLDPDNIPFLATGSPGGSQITTTVLQILLNAIDHSYDIATAVALPRIHSQLFPDVLYYEDGISKDSIDKLILMGHTTEKIKAIGSAQSIYYDKNSRLFHSTADPRRSGALALAY